MFKKVFPDQKSYKQEHLVHSFLEQTYNAHNAAGDAVALLDLYEKAPAIAKSNEKYQFTVKSVQGSIASIENKKKHLAGYIFLIEDKTVSDYMAKKLSSGGISVETLQTIANDKGVDRLDELLRPFTRKKIAASMYTELCE